MARRKHLATCGHVGVDGYRNGTSYAYTPAEVSKMVGKPWFRYRNEESKTLCLLAWMRPDTIAEAIEYYIHRVGGSPEAARQSLIDANIFTVDGTLVPDRKS